MNRSLEYIEGSIAMNEALDISNEEIANVVPLWPLIFQSLAITICLGCSTIFHVGKDRDCTANWWLSKLDYLGICFNILGCSTNIIFYGFACSDVHHSRNAFALLLICMCFGSFKFSLNPSFNDASKMPVRVGLFLALGWSAAMPLA